MGVYKSARSESTAEFVQAAFELRKYTIHYVAKFPKRWQRTITDNILDLAGKIYADTLRANAVYLHKGMNENDFEVRHRYLTLAQSNTKALLGELTFLYELVKNGNNFFRGASDYNHAFEVWTGVGCKTLNKIRGVINSDKQRWNKIMNAAK